MAGLVKRVIIEGKSCLSKAKDCQLGRLCVPSLSDILGERRPAGELARLGSVTVNFQCGEATGVSKEKNSMQEQELHASHLKSSSQGSSHLRQTPLLPFCLHENDLGARGACRTSSAGTSRSFAAKSKGKSNKKNRRDSGDDDEDAAGGATFNLSGVYAEMNDKMEAAVEALGRELGKLRTGRATPGMLDHVNVPIAGGGGAHVPLSHVAAITVRDAQTLSVTVHDASLMKAVQKAISDSPLGLNPVATETSLAIPVPGLTNEVKQAMLKLMGKAENSAKESLRRARHDSLQAIKKGLPKADLPKKQKEVDEITKKYTKRIEDACNAKEKQIASGS